MDIPDEVRDDLESRANVVGSGRGPKRVNGQTTDEECLVVLVSRKVPEDELAAADKVPKEIDIDGKRVKTDVQEVGDVRAQATATRPAEKPDRKRRWRPAPAGVSMGHPEITAGTLGSPPLETEDGRTVALTNAHVAAPVGIAQRDDDVLQPGAADGGTREDAIGTLYDFSKILKDEPNSTDSALVEVEASTLTGTVLEIGAFTGFTEPTMDATYTKSGRTTGVTTGELRIRDARIKVSGYYEEPTVFEGVDVFGPMSAGGDSGSLIGVEDGGFRATHLLFAGSDRSTIGIPLSAVEAEHGELRPRASPGEDGGTTSFRDAVGERLGGAYGTDAVSDGDGVDFRVTGPVSMAVAVVEQASSAPDAAGRALVAADAGAVPVLAYPTDVEDVTIQRLGNRLALMPVEWAEP